MQIEPLIQYPIYFFNKSSEMGIDIIILVVIITTARSAPSTLALEMRRGQHSGSSPQRSEGAARGEEGTKGS